MEDKSLFELATRLNEIMVESNKLALEHNQIIEEITRRLPHLKGDKNLELKLVKEINDGR